MEIKLYGQVIQLEVICTECWGDGYETRNNGQTKRTCNMCNGLGYVPTENGKAILAFLKKYMSPVDKE